jgi:nicotinate phosphoribosyltransferase
METMDRALFRPGDLALFTDLYELSMLEVYHAEGMHERAVFSLFVRELPERRNYLVACGQEDVLEAIARLRFDDDAIAYLGRLGRFSERFLAWLGGFRFTGDVHAVPEGTPVLANEPILEVVAPLPEAQLIETLVMNQVHLQTVLASKAARVVAAAEGRRVVDFGPRRMHGIDAALKAARAFHIAGIDATSNVLAGRVYGVPVVGTMAHSLIQAFDLEADAFRAFVRTYPDTVLLIDTYDTAEGARKVVALARELGEAFRVRGVRLDSGDLLALSKEVRAILDEAGLGAVEVFASGGLDEDEIARLVGEGAPIGGFGVGTDMGVSRDVPALDIAYKLTEYAGRGRLKLSTGKPVLPGRKQVFRQERDGVAVGDVIARDGEEQPGRPLLRKVMEGGRRLEAPDLDHRRRLAALERARLPAPVRGLGRADPGYPVEVSEALRAHQRDVARGLGG